MSADDRRRSVSDRPGLAPERVALNLRAVLRARIESSGPVDIGTFMEIALGHPKGYYATRDPLGARGDFTTAPEISQIFGEMIGLWAADVWDKIGRPDPVLIVECGPGRGTLLADALRAAQVLPGFCRAAHVHLIETSPVLRACQSRALKDFIPVWHEELGTLPPGPAIVLANEFLDALPIRQLVRMESGWAERFVDADGADGFCFMLRPAAPETIESLPLPCRKTAPGQIVEIAPVREAFVTALSERLLVGGGAALMIDYGHLSSGPGDTLQAVRAHRFAPVLEDIGEADLTAHVDFERLALGARAGGVQVGQLVEQGDFLRRLGGPARLEALCRSNPERAEELRSGFHRLSAPEAMGRLFKVMALWHGLKTPPEGIS